MRAFCKMFLLANSDEALCGPAETSDAWVLTSTQPSSNFGAGTSVTVISALRASWKTCFILFLFAGSLPAASSRKPLPSLKNSLDRSLNHAAEWLGVRDLTQAHTVRP